MKSSLLLILLMSIGLSLFSQTNTKNLIIITLDGLRWQEVFGGIDTAIVNNKKFTTDADQVKKKFGDDDSSIKRTKLFPFLWNTVAKKGLIYGNRNKGSNVNVANTYWFSYPGYNEIFTGYPDTTVNSNDKRWNKNENVLEYLQRQQAYKNKVAVFTTWDAFPYIFNKQRNGLYVNSDVDSLHFKENSLSLINEMQFLTSRPIDVRPDIFTYFAAREYLKIYRPKVLYISFDETDDFAHEGNYNQYIKSAHAEDDMMADLWKWVQSDPEYKGNTTLIVTCDHGRGDKKKEEWTSHGSKVEGSDQIWIAAIGPDTQAKGEAIPSKPLFQGQLAATFASILGFHFQPPHPFMDPIEELYH